MPLNEGDLVGVSDTEVSYTTEGADVLAVVSRKAMVEGSTPADTSRYDTLAYAGRVPVRVRGPVHCGDRITPSGLEDGTG